MVRERCARLILFGDRLDETGKRGVRRAIGEGFQTQLTSAESHAFYLITSSVSAAKRWRTGTAAALGAGSKGEAVRACKAIVVAIELRARKETTEMEGRRNEKTKFDFLDLGVTTL